MYLGLTYCTVREFHGGNAFHLPPTSSAVSALQIASDVDTSARCNGLNVPDLAEDLESWVHLSYPRANLGQTCPLLVLFHEWRTFLSR